MYNYLESHVTFEKDTIHKNLICEISGFVDDEKFKESLLSYLRLLSKFPVDCVIWDFSFLQSGWDTLNEWITESILPALISTGVKKVAVVCGEDAFNEFSYIRLELMVNTQHLPIELVKCNTTNAAKVWSRN
ncbi:hypothetical protein [Sediminitomix flava]|uniref:SpoIIAA-like protein n=1 Tax=Sediminitomix flava TaxID=379075 RepID=A0A315Z6Q9_SEDFL|nr:hypothetical protein [Sediminitomix flava]PWJ40077.1 hypothetical protein BC781_105140 [Sediminitomix flava]